MVPSSIADAPLRSRPATWIAPLLGLLVLLAQGTASAFTTTVSPSDAFAQARADLSVTAVLDTVTLDGVPDVQFPSASSTSGEATASASAPIVLTNDVFAIGLSADQTSNTGSSALVGGGIAFSVDASVAYDLSGLLNVADLGDTGQFASLFVQLGTRDSQQVLFLQDQASDGIPDPQFVLGVDNGFGAPEGSLTGMLQANTEYLLEFGAEVRQSGELSGFEPSLSAGKINLTLVPEPGTAALLGLGLAGLGVVGRSRRQEGSP